MTYNVFSGTLNPTQYSILNILLVIHSISFTRVLCSADICYSLAYWLWLDVLSTQWLELSWVMHSRTLTLSWSMRRMMSVGTTLLHEPTGLSSSRTHCLHCCTSQQVSHHPTLIAYTAPRANRSLIPHSKTQSQLCISALFLLLSKKLIFITYCSVCYNILKLGL